MMDVQSTDRGETSAQVAILAPVLFFCVFATFHFAAYWMSALTASAAATRGARAASIAGTADHPWNRGIAAVEETVSELGGVLAQVPTIDIEGDDVVVTVALRVSGAVPHFPHLVRRSIRMRSEHFMGESDR